MRGGRWRKRSQVTANDVGCSAARQQLTAAKIVKLKDARSTVVISNSRQEDKRVDYKADKL